MLLLNKDKRSLLFSMLLGDGSLYYSGRSNKRKLRNVTFSLIHGDKQVDYLCFKRDLLQEITGKTHKITSLVVKGNKNYHWSHRVRISMRRFRAWRRFTYPNNKKDLTKILPFIRHPELALAILFMDDGTVNYRKSKNYCDLRLHTDGHTIKEVNYLNEWLFIHFGIRGNLYLRKYGPKTTAKLNQYEYPILRFNVKEGLIIWSIIRNLVLSIKSMQVKFNNYEQFYQKRCNKAHS